MISNASKIGIISDIATVVQMRNLSPPLSHGKKADLVKVGTPGAAKRRVKRKAKKLARRANR